MKVFFLENTAYRKHNSSINSVYQAKIEFFDKFSLSSKKQDQDKLCFPLDKLDFSKIVFMIAKLSFRSKDKPRVSKNNVFRSIKLIENLVFAYEKLRFSLHNPILSAIN